MRRELRLRQQWGEDTEATLLTLAIDGQGWLSWRIAVAASHGQFSSPWTVGLPGLALGGGWLGPGRIGLALGVRLHRRAWTLALGLNGEFQESQIPAWIGAVRLDLHPLVSR